MNGLLSMLLDMQRFIGYGESKSLLCGESFHGLTHFLLLVLSSFINDTPNQIQVDAF